MGRKNIQQERQLQIIKALNRCLLKKSYKETTIKDIAAEAGINHGMLHYYFKEKEEILLGFVDFILSKHKNEFIRWRDAQQTGDMTQKEILKSFLQYTNEKITLNRNLSKVFITLWEISLNNRKVKSQIKRVYQEWIELACEPLKSSFGDESAKQIMFSMVAYLEGMAMFSVVFNMGKDENRQILERFEERILNSIFPEE
ncbi:TetR/AcrR family transcriptional regulator [bacterium]|nr:TetR/AcrR family transcriptional regulator [bacterium]